MLFQSFSLSFFILIFSPSCGSCSSNIPTHAQYFERAAEIEPHEVKWRLMVASCYRRMGAYQQALDLYRGIHAADADNLECLRYLCTITKDLGDKAHEEYAKKLRKAERALESQESQFHRDDEPVQNQGYGGGNGGGYGNQQQHHHGGNDDDEDEGGHVGALLAQHHHQLNGGGSGGGTSLGGGGGGLASMPHIAPRSVSRAQQPARGDADDDDDASIGDLLPM